MAGSLGQYRQWARVASNQQKSEENSDKNDFGSYRSNNPNHYSEDGFNHVSQGGSSINSVQMQNLQKRMMQAREQNVAARQRVANQVVQGNTQYDNRRASDRRNSNQDADFNSFLHRDGSDMLRGFSDKRSEQDVRGNRSRHAGYLDSDFDALDQVENSSATKTNNNRNSNRDNDRSINKEKSDSNDDRDLTLPTVPTGLSTFREKEESKDQISGNMGKSDELRGDEKMEKNVDQKKEEAKENVPIKKKKKHLKRPVSPLKSPVPSPYIEDLSTLHKDIAKVVVENTATLGETSEDRKVKENLKSAEFIEERRKKLRELLASKNNKDIVRLPMWRHHLRGDFNPPEEDVMKGKVLFQAIVRSLILLCIRPTLDIMKRKIAMRDRERTDLARTIHLYTDATKAWIGKCVRIPLVTLEQVSLINLFFYLKHTN
jgi:hypothetical protein